MAFLVRAFQHFYRTFLAPHSKEHIQAQRICNDAFLQIMTFDKKQKELFEKIKESIKVGQVSAAERHEKQIIEIGRQMIHLHQSLRVLGEELNNCSSDDKIRALGAGLAEELKKVAMKGNSSKSVLDDVVTTLQVSEDMKRKNQEDAVYVDMNHIFPHSNIDDGDDHDSDKDNHQVSVDIKPDEKGEALQHFSDHPDFIEVQKPKRFLHRSEQLLSS